MCNIRNTTVRTCLHETHLSNFISNNIYDRNIKEHECRFIGKTNTIICDFGCCDSSTLVNIHSIYTEEMHIACLKAMRIIWKLHPRTHNIMIGNVTTNYTHSL